MAKDYVPYFVVYRYKGNPCDNSLYLEGFVTLRQLYAFIGNNVERWSEYFVGRTLETYSI